MKFDINDYRGRYAMYCGTQKEAEEFCKYLHSVGRKWASGMRYDEQHYFGRYGIHGVYCFNIGVKANLLDAICNGYKILKWSDFKNQKFSKANLKTGDVIKRRNGSVEVMLPSMGISLSTTGQMLLSSLCEDLTYRKPDNEITDVPNADLDIIAVRRPTMPLECGFEAFEKEYGEIVYEREEVESMTLEDVCAALGKKIKIVENRE